MLMMMLLLTMVSVIQRKAITAGRFAGRWLDAGNKEKSASGHPLALLVPSYVMGSQQFFR
jgi:hypothetical protein